MELILADINDLRPTMESLYLFIGSGALIVALISIIKYKKSLINSLISALFVFSATMYISYIHLDEWYYLNIKNNEVQLSLKTGNVRYIDMSDIVSVTSRPQRGGACIIYLRTENKKYSSIQINKDLCKHNVLKIKSALSS